MLPTITKSRSAATTTLVSALAYKGGVNSWVFHRLPVIKYLKILQSSDPADILQQKTLLKRFLYARSTDQTSDMASLKQAVAVYFTDNNGFASYCQRMPWPIELIKLALIVQWRLLPAEEATRQSARYKLVFNLLYDYDSDANIAELMYPLLSSTRKRQLWEALPTIAQDLPARQELTITFFSQLDAEIQQTMIQDMIELRLNPIGPRTSETHALPDQTHFLHILPIEVYRNYLTTDQKTTFLANLSQKLRLLEQAWNDVNLSRTRRHLAWTEIIIISRILIDIGSDIPETNKIQFIAYFMRRLSKLSTANSFVQKEADLLVPAVSVMSKGLKENNIAEFLSMIWLIRGSSDRAKNWQWLKVLRALGSYVDAVAKKDPTKKGIREILIKQIPRVALEQRMDLIHAAKEIGPTLDATDKALLVDALIAQLTSPYLPLAVLACDVLQSLAPDATADTQEKLLPHLCQLQQRIDALPKRADDYPMERKIVGDALETIASRLSKAENSALMDFLLGEPQQFTSLNRNTFFSRVMVLGLIEPYAGPESRARLRQFLIETYLSTSVNLALREISYSVLQHIGFSTPGMDIRGPLSLDVTLGDLNSPSPFAAEAAFARLTTVIPYFSEHLSIAERNRCIDAIFQGNEQRHLNIIEIWALELLGVGASDKDKQRIIQAFSRNMMLIEEPVLTDAVHDDYERRRGLNTGLMALIMNTSSLSVAIQTEIKHNLQRGSRPEGVELRVMIDEAFTVTTSVANVERQRPQM